MPNAKWKNCGTVRAGVAESEPITFDISPAGHKAWLFPSENLEMPLSKDNALYRYIRPRLKMVGLEWVNYQVMRRTHSSLMHELGVDPKFPVEQPT